MLKLICINLRNKFLINILDEEIIMKLGEECRTCLLKSQSKKVENYIDKVKKEKFIEEATKLCQTYTSNSASPLLMREINNIHKRVFGVGLDYSKEKIKYNQLCLSFEEQIEKIIFSDEDPLKKAIQFARVGNLIDFAKLTSIDIDLFEYFNECAKTQDVDNKVLELLKYELKNKKNLTYLLDNCGEIVFDKILIKVIKQEYPHLNITSVVRGKEIINDCTFFDAEMVGLNLICKVIDNGTDIPGTYLEEVSLECLNQIKNSDLIVAKGLGNFETLHGSKLNIYYMFLCKCKYFADKFNLKQWESVLTNERFLVD